MSDFKTALAITLPHEGGYAKIEGDDGGETYQGISRNNWGSWRGWSIIDKSKPVKYNQVLKDKNLAGLVEVFYYEHFWKPIQGDKINSQSIVNFLFDWFVNSGFHAIKALQKLVGVNEDGIIGPVSISAINAANPSELLPKYKAARLKFYKDIVTRNPNQQKFLAGWIKRAESFTG